MFWDYNLEVSGEIAGKQVGTVQCSFALLLFLPGHSTNVVPWASGGFGGSCSLFLMEREKEELRSSSASLFPAGDFDPLHPRPPVTFTHSHLCSLSIRVCHGVHRWLTGPTLLALTLSYCVYSVKFGEEASIVCSPALLLVLGFLKICMRSC